MTAIVGILNKKGIAIAADSASTLSNNKIINSGNKMLRLSNILPAAVMVVNNSTLADMPWEVIIRWYRKEKGQTKFETLQACIDDFMDFVNHEALSREDIGSETCYFDERRNPDKKDVTTHLVFTGYGESETMPTICEYCVYGIDKRKIMYKRCEGYIITSPEKDVTIYSQGQFKIIKSYIQGVIDEYVNKLIEGHINIFMKLNDRLPYQFLSTEIVLSNKQSSLPIGTIRTRMNEVVSKCQKESEQEWLKAVKDYNLQEMASLAENLIKATELHKKIINEAEEVGGLIDLAVITKNDGFQWLNRKSWYDPSRGGQYGKFGI